jgi:hypothetical protein
MHGVVPDLQKVEVARDRARRPTRRKLDVVSTFKFGNLIFGEPDGNLDGDGARVVREHEVLQRRVPQLIGADSRNDERGGCRCRVLFAVDDDAVGVRKRRARLRGAGLRIIVAAE